MAAISNDPLFWAQKTIPSEEVATYPRYISELRNIQLSDRTAIVLASVGIGAGVGASIGSAVAGVGTLPGAAGGAIVGAIVGMVATSVYDYKEYKEYRASITQEARDSIDRILQENNDLCHHICAITQTIPLHPVFINGETQVYERSALIETLKRQGASPLTRQPFTAADIRPSIETMALVGKICDQILNDPQCKEKYGKTELRGMSILRKENLKIVNAYYNQEWEKIKKGTASNGRSISPLSASLKACALAKIVDPLIGDKANAARVEQNFEDFEEGKSSAS